MDRPPTAFEQRVYAAISQIPAGCVTTYRELARYLDCGSAQAIGQALKRNPYAPEVPCHRVVKADMGLGGYHGETEEGPTLQRKRQRLLDEGIEFTSAGKIAASHHYTFPISKHDDTQA